MAESVGSGSLQGKVCLITGATAGIGEVAARELARKGARVVLVGRSRERCEATLGRIREEVPGAEVEALVADLSSQSEIRRLAGEFRMRFDRLDILLNNAGALFAQRQETADGIERTWALNHLAYFLLTNLLLEPLQAAAPSRVVCVASGAHRAVPGLNWDDLEGRQHYRPFRAYSQSKLANILFARELARRLEGAGVTANALHPGFVATNFMAGNGWLGVFLRLSARLIAIKPEQGARTSIYLASSPEVEGLTGRYFEKCREARPSKAALDDDAARRLWEISMRMTGLSETPDAPPRDLSDPSQPTAHESRSPA